MASNYRAISEFNEKQLGMDRKSRMSQVAMYADTAHFVYEILQNADDVGATEIFFSVSENQLIVEHNGTPFTEHNVKAISYFGMGKTDITKIGHFGLGFKSVFAYTASPRVHSGNESFEITELYTVNGVPYPKDLAAFRTRFVLPFDHYLKKPDYIERSKLKTNKDAYQEIGEKLANLGSESLLFTSALKEIHWETDDDEGHYLREDNPIGDNIHETYIVTGDDEDKYYLLFNRPIYWPDDNGTNRERRPIQLAFALDKQLKDGGTIEEIEDACLSVFFPTDKATNVGFIIQGPYRTTPARDNIPPNDEFNRHLVKETALLLDDCLPKIKKLNLLDCFVLSLLPVEHDKFREGTLFHPLYLTVRNSIENQPLLPTASRGFTKGIQAKLARGAELTKIFGPAQLEQLFKTPGLKWLDSDLTQNNYPSLYKLLVGRKATAAAFKQAEWIIPPIAPNIELGSDDVAKFINEDFMSCQSDDWIARFYIYLSGMGSYSQRDFLRKPIIRLENGSHVTPFSSKDVPNAFLPIDDDDETSLNGLPTVKRALVKRKEVRSFLEEDVELTTPDLADFVVTKILPRYTPAPAKFSEKAWKQHLQQILKAHQSTTSDKREFLETKLEEAEFLVLSSFDDSSEKLGKLDEAYLDTAELKKYFEGEDEVYFLLKSKYRQEDIQQLLKLGVADTPRVNKRPTDYYGNVSVCSWHGWHKRGLEGYDPDWSIEGLENAVLNPTVERSMLIWKLIRPHYKCIRGVLEKSTRQNFSDSKKAEEISTTGKLLMEAEWLPDKSGKFHAPENLGLDDLPDGFDKVSEKAKALSLKLGMRQNEKQQALAVLAEGNEKKRRILERLQNADEDTLDKFDKLVPKKQVAPEFKSFRSGIESLHRPQKQELPITQPPSGVNNPGRYQQKVDEDTKEKLDEIKTKPNIIRFGLVRATSSNSEARTFLYEEYCGKCQVSGETFLKADGKNYFEAISLVPKIDAEYLNHAGNMLCLSAESAAKFCYGNFEWIDDLETKIKEFKAEKDGGTPEHRQIKIRLVGKVFAITWSERHFMRLISLWNHV